MLKRFLLLFALTAQMTTMSAAKTVIDRIDPTDWFVGMKNPQVQLMVYGKDIAAVKEVSTDYPGVKIDSVVRLDSPNYLLVYMNLRDAKAGTMTLKFDKKKVEYTLKNREMSGKKRMGFTIADYDVWHALAAALLIAAVTFVICISGIFIGKKAGMKLAGKATVFGGVLLIGIGLEIFLTHMLH